MEEKIYNKKDYEIMAPVGSYESLMAAINAGADSIYFGIEGLNMRSKSANNFTTEDLYKISNICSENNVKSYLTVNTIIYDEDISLMKKIIDAAKDSKVSAIIASDVAAMMYAREIGVEVHLSTQLNITNVDSLKFYSQFADVVVLARELNLEQVKYIYDSIVKENIKGPSGEHVRIEMFAHGALCMAVSGKCYLSLHENSKSANRGACTQICRRSYDVKDRESGIELAIDNQYIMSPKDLKTIHFINKMLDSGVRVLKIEGRARGPEYVDTVVRAYREAIDSYCDGKYDEASVNRWDTKLSEVFNRGFWDGYYLGKRLGEWTPNYGSSATKQKRFVASCMKYFSKIGIGEFKLESGELSVGDEVIITGPTTGLVRFNVEELRFDLEPVKTVIKGQTFSMPVPEKVRPSDRVYIFEDRKTLQK